MMVLAVHIVRDRSANSHIARAWHHWQEPAARGHVKHAPCAAILFRQSWRRTGVLRHAMRFRFSGKKTASGSAWGRLPHPAISSIPTAPGRRAVHPACGKAFSPLCESLAMPAPDRLLPIWPRGNGNAERPRANHAPHRDPARCAPSGVPSARGPSNKKFAGARTQFRWVWW